MSLLGIDTYTHPAYTEVSPSLWRAQGQLGCHAHKDKQTESVVLHLVELKVCLVGIPGTDTLIINPHKL